MFGSLNTASVQDAQDRCGPGREISGGIARGPMPRIFASLPRRPGAHAGNVLKGKDSALSEALQSEEVVTLHPILGDAQREARLQEPEEIEQLRRLALLAVLLVGQRSGLLFRT